MYVIDKEVMVYQRPSLPNLKQFIAGDHRSCDLNACCRHLKSIAFNSQATYPTMEDFVDSSHPMSISTSSAKSEDEAVWGSESSTALSELSTCNTVLPHGNERMPQSSTACTQMTSCNEISSHQASRKKNGEDVEDIVNKERFEMVAEAIRDGFGLSLFGFDVILPNNSHSSPDVGVAAPERDLVVIDVNFFPSYKEVEDFPFRLKKFLRKRAGLQPYIDNT